MADEDQEKVGEGIYAREFGLLLIGALVLTVSLIWKDLIMEIEEYFFPIKEGGLKQRFLVTVLLTFIVITVIIIMRSYLGVSSDDSV